MRSALLLVVLLAAKAHAEGRALKCEVAPIKGTALFEARYATGVKGRNHLALDEESNVALDRVAAEVGPFGIDVVDELVTE